MFSGQADEASQIPLVTAEFVPPYALRANPALVGLVAPGGSAPARVLARTPLLKARLLFSSIGKTGERAEIRGLSSVRSSATLEELSDHGCWPRLRYAMASEVALGTTPQAALSKGIARLARRSYPLRNLGALSRKQTRMSSLTFT